MNTPTDMLALAMDIWILPPQIYGGSAVATIVATEDESFAAAINAIIEKEFPEYRHDWIRKMVGNFGNVGGKSAVLTALLRASGKNGKLGEAMELLDQYWERFWKPEYSEVAGDPITDLNKSRWMGFYGDIGIPLTA